MLQFIGRCCSKSNVAYKMQRYTNLFVTSKRASRSSSPTFWGLFRPLLLSDLCGLSERSERAREQHFIICGQDSVTYSKRRRARKIKGLGRQITKSLTR